MLDLASHDGRWSLAGAQTGASYVLGIEARAHLVAAAGEHLSQRLLSNRSYGAPAGVRRLNPKHLIIDTRISSQPEAMIELWEEASEFEAAADFAELGSPGQCAGATRV